MLRKNSPEILNKSVKNQPRLKNPKYKRKEFNLKKRKKLIKDLSLLITDKL